MIKQLTAILQATVKTAIYLAAAAVAALGGYFYFWTKLPLFTQPWEKPFFQYQSMIRDNLWFLLSLALLNLLCWKLEGWKLPAFIGWKALLKRTGIACVISVAWLGATFLLFFASQLVGLVRVDSIEKTSLIFLDILLWGKLSSAFMQEFALRGYLYRYLEKKFSYRTAILVTSLLFWLWHMGKLLYGWLAFVNVFFIGLLLAVVRWMTDSLWVPALVHYFWNAVFFVTMIGGQGAVLWVGPGFDNAVPGTGSLGIEQGLVVSLSTLGVTILLLLAYRKKKQFDTKQNMQPIPTA